MREEHTAPAPMQFPCAVWLGRRPLQRNRVGLSCECMSSTRRFGFAELGAVVLFIIVAPHATVASSDYLLYVSNERSGDVTIIDGTTGTVAATIPVGKRPRGVHCSPDGSRVYVALSGSPRMGPGVDHARAPADRSADGIGVIDAATKKFLRKLLAGSDPEQFALTRDGTKAIISDEDK